MAAALFVPSLVVSTTTGWPLVLTIIVLGSFVTLYTMLGGIEGIIWTDVIQFCLMLGGVAATLAITVYSVPGGVSGIWDYAVSQGKTNLIAPIPPEANTLWDQLRFIFTDYRSIVGIMTTLAFGYVLSLILPASCPTNSDN